MSDAVKHHVINPERWRRPHFAPARVSSDIEPRIKSDSVMFTF